MVAGSAIGWIFKVALQQSKKKDWIDKESSLVYTVALAMFTCGLVRCRRWDLIITPADE